MKFFSTDLTHLRIVLRVHMRLTWTVVIKFCLFMGFPSVPATTFNICLYAAFLARSLKASSVRQYVGIIGTLHKNLV